MIADDDRTTRRLAAALTTIAPGRRALLELAARHCLDEEQIARLTDRESGDVALERDHALNDLARQLGVEASTAWRALSDLPDTQWAAACAGPAGTVHRAAQRPPPAADVSARSIRAMVMLAVGTVVVEVVIAVVAVLLGGG